MPRISERSRQISDSAGSLMRLKKHLMLLTACKVSKTLINATFKAHALQYVNYVKLVNNRYLEPRGKNRIYKGRSAFMRHLHDKVGEKEYMNEKEFLARFNRPLKLKIGSTSVLGPLQARLFMTHNTEIHTCN